MAIYDLAYQPYRASNERYLDIDIHSTLVATPTNKNRHIIGNWGNGIGTNQAKWTSIGGGTFVGLLINNPAISKADIEQIIIPNEHYRIDRQHSVGGNLTVVSGYGRLLSIQEPLNPTGLFLEFDTTNAPNIGVDITTLGVAFNAFVDNTETNYNWVIRENASRLCWNASAGAELPVNWIRLSEPGFDFFKSSPPITLNRVWCYNSTQFTSSFDGGNYPVGYYWRSANGQLPHLVPDDFAEVAAFNVGNPSNAGYAEWYDVGGVAYIRYTSTESGSVPSGSTSFQYRLRLTKNNTGGTGGLPMGLPGYSIGALTEVAISGGLSAIRVGSVADLQAGFGSGNTINAGGGQWVIEKQSATWL